MDGLVHIHVPVSWTAPTEAVISEDLLAESISYNKIPSRPQRWCPTCILAYLKRVCSTLKGGLSHLYHQDTMWFLLQLQLENLTKQCRRRFKLFTSTKSPEPQASGELSFSTLQEKERVL